MILAPAVGILHPDMERPRASPLTQLSQQSPTGKMGVILGLCMCMAIIVTGYKASRRSVGTRAGVCVPVWAMGTLCGYGGLWCPGISFTHLSYTPGCPSLSTCWVPDAAVSSLLVLTLHLIVTLGSRCPHVIDEEAGAQGR